jgi:hypothetical protein
MLGMRRTMWVVPLDLVPVVHAAIATTLERNQRRLLVKLVEEGGIVDDGAAWTRTMERAALRELRRRGEASANQLTKAVPGLDAKVSYGEGKSWAGTIGVSNRVLIVLGTAGKVVRGRPRGTWISTQYHWSPVETWLPGGLTGWAAEEARAALAERWLAAYGPATPADLKWWTGWTGGHVKAALAGLDTVAVDLDGTPGVLLARDAEPVEPPGPWVALLPALDPTIMGWVSRDWYLGPHGPTLFDRSGNPGPTVWVDGRVVGGWAQRASDGRVVYRLLEKVSAAERTAIERRAEELTSWLEPTKVTPRFRTPLERELAAS